jgi:hypothetical protein
VLLTTAHSVSTNDADYLDALHSGASATSTHR